MIAVSNGPSRPRRDVRRQARRPVRRHDADEYLPRRVRRRPARDDRPSGTTPTASPSASSTCRARATSPTSASRSPRSACAGSRLLRHPLSERQGRPPRPARLRCGRDGEPGVHHVPREPAARRPGGGDPERAPARRRRGRPRTRPHVVRRSRHDELVERHLVERGVRDVHGDRGLRRVPPRLGAMDFVRSRAQRRLRDRCAVSTRPVEYEVRSPADCEGMFDVLTYQKGGALLRMLEQYLGAERFREGVSHYLRTHAFANTETSDLWDAIEHTSGEPVRRIMDSWIWQPGYPLDLGQDARRRVGPSASGASRSTRKTHRRHAGRSPSPCVTGGRTDTALLDGDELRLPLDRRPGRRQRRWPRFLPRVLLRRSPRSVVAEGRCVDDHLGALQPRRRCLERGHGTRPGRT